MKHLVRFVAAVSSFFVLAGGTDVAASPSAASASEQVKALCDSSIAKSKAGDVAGAQADINQAIANVARVHLQYIGDPPNWFETLSSSSGKVAPHPADQRYYDNAVAAIEAIYKGNIEEAKRFLDMPVTYSRENYTIYYAGLDAYIIIGDFTKARESLHYLETDPFVGRFTTLAPDHALIGDQTQAQNNITSALKMLPGDDDSPASYCSIAEGQIEIGDFPGAQSSMGMAAYRLRKAGKENSWQASKYRDVSNGYSIFSKNPTLCWGNPANPRRVAMAQVSKARCELALAQALAGDMGAAKETLYFIIDEQDKIATEKAIAQAGANFLQSGNVAKGIETLVVIPPAKQATAAQIRETIKTWLNIKNAKLAEMLAKLSPQEKEAFKTSLELAILDCVTQANAAKNMSIAAAENRQGDPIALSELSDNYLNLQNVLKAVYKSLSEE